MLRFFHHNKLRYEKGQFAPIFIALLAIILIMALITVNLSKIALTKTDTSNAVDAGGLACGSAMATVFNTVAASNIAMEAAYWEFLLTASALFGTAMTINGMAIANATSGVVMGTVSEGSGGAAVTTSPPTAWTCPSATAEELASIMDDFASTSAGGASTFSGISSMLTGVFISIIYSLMTTITGFYIAQKYFFLEIRRNAQKGRRDGLRLGYQFAFRNSGIASKLKDGLPEGMAMDILRGVAGGLLGAFSSSGFWNSFNFSSLLNDSEELLADLDFSGPTNYRDVFSLFMSFIQHGPMYAYPWADGQGRTHAVVVTEYTQDVDDYRLQVTSLPYPAELGLLVGVRVLASLAMVETSIAVGTFAGGATAFLTASGELTAAVPGSTTCCLPPPATCSGAASAEPPLQVSRPTNGGGIGADTAGIATDSAAITALIAMLPTLVAAYTGILPTRTAMSPASTDIIAWIDDIIHDRRVYMATLQQHQGNLLQEQDNEWRTTYFPTLSYCVTDFSGSSGIFGGGGDIHPPKPNFDASIIMTDSLETIGEELTRVNDVCYLVRGEVQRLSDLRDGHQDSGDGLDDPDSGTLSLLGGQLGHLQDFGGGWPGQIGGGVLQGFLELLNSLLSLVGGLVPGLSGTIGNFSGLLGIFGNGNSIISGLGNQFGTATGDLGSVLGDLDNLSQEHGDTVTDLQGRIDQLMSDYSFCY